MAAVQLKIGVSTLTTSAQTALMGAYEMRLLDNARFYSTAISAYLAEKELTYEVTYRPETGVDKRPWDAINYDADEANNPSFKNMIKDFEVFIDTKERKDKLMVLTSGIEMLRRESKL